MDHEAVFTFEYPTPESARRVQRSVQLEAGDIEGDRTRASVSRTDERVTVTIEAADLIALRAGLNTWASLVEVAERCSGASQTA
ncbi:MAG: KEOPS complex subunit Pcc1 [Halapricum sp.]